MAGFAQEALVAAGGCIAGGCMTGGCMTGGC
jgi:hypothetical protein